MRRLEQSCSNLMKTDRVESGERLCLIIVVFEGSLTVATPGYYAEVWQYMFEH